MLNTEGVTTAAAADPGETLPRCGDAWAAAGERAGRGWKKVKTEEEDEEQPDQLGALDLDPTAEIVA